MHNYEVMDNIFNNRVHRVSQWNDDVLNPNLLQEYADVTHEKGAPLENCFGFIDLTVRPIARRNAKLGLIVFKNVNFGSSSDLYPCFTTQKIQ